MLGYNYTLSAFSRGGEGGALAGAGYQPVILAVAQSNSVAASQNDPLPTFPGGGNALQMGRFPSAAGTLESQDMTLIPAAHPLDNVQISTNTKAYNYMHEFASRFYADPAKSGQTLVIIPCAIGGSSLSPTGTWSAEDDPIGAGLQDAIDRVNQFYTDYPAANDAVFVNCQGESDIILQYTERWSKCRAAFINQCPRITHTTPWVEIGLLNQSSLSHLARARFPDVFRHVAFVPTSGTVGFDGIHFTNSELDTIGDAAYDAWADAIAADSVDIGLGTGFTVASDSNLPNSGNTFASTGFLTVNNLGATPADGFELVMPANPSNFSRAIWLFKAADFELYSSYVITFDVEVTDLTDTIAFTAGNNNVLSSAAASATLQSQVSTPNTVTPFRLVVNTGATSFASTAPYIGFRRSLITGAVATTVRVTNFKVSTIEGARLGWETV